MNNKDKMQTSESFILSALISFSGGLQDAYTYNLRDKVFANSQTGNIVLMSQHLMSREWLKGFSYLLPIFSFVLGIIIAEQISSSYKTGKRIHWRQVVLVLEILILFLVGFIGTSLNMVANALVSLSCAMQVQSFRTMHGYGYASTMCIGNLRSGTESLSVFFRTKEPSSLKKALNYYCIIIVFALGAGIGGILSPVFGLKTIWLSALILAAAFILMLKKYTPANSFIR